MAKKKKEEVVEEPLVQEPIAVEQEPAPEDIYVEPKPKRSGDNTKVLNDGWEFKNRIYRLKGKKKPLSRTIEALTFIGLMKKKVTKENLNTVLIKELASLTK